MKYLLPVLLLALVDLAACKSADRIHFRNGREYHPTSRLRIRGGNFSYRILKAEELEIENNDFISGEQVLTGRQFERKIRIHINAKNFGNQSYISLGELLIRLKATDPSMKDGDLPCVGLNLYDYGLFQPGEERDVSFDCLLPASVHLVGIQYMGSTVPMRGPVYRPHLQKYFTTRK